MKPEDEISIYRWSAGTSGRGTTRREGTSDRVEISLRESRSSRSQGGRGLVGSTVGKGKGES